MYLQLSRNIIRPKIEGTWKNSDKKIQITLTRIQGKSDEYALEYKTVDKILDEDIHISNTDNILWHIVDNITIGAGLLKFVSENEMLINTSKIIDLRLLRD